MLRRGEVSRRIRRMFMRRSRECLRRRCFFLSIQRCGATPEKEAEREKESWRDLEGEKARARERKREREREAVPRVPAAGMFLPEAGPPHPPVHLPVISLSHTHAHAMRDGLLDAQRIALLLPSPLHVAGGGSRVPAVGMFLPEDHRPNPAVPRPSREKERERETERESERESEQGDVSA